MDGSNECISNDGIITVEQFKAIYPHKRKSKIEAALCESLEDLQKQNSSLEQYIENFIEIADKLAEKYNREREEREGIIHVQGYPHGLGFYDINTLKLVKYKDCDGRVFTEDDGDYTFKLDVKKYITDNQLVQEKVRKTVFVNAEHGKNEIVTTLTPDRYLETTSYANETDWVLNNIGTDDEKRKWVVSDEIFKRKYRHVKDNIFEPVYTMFAYKVHENIVFRWKRGAYVTMFFLGKGGYLMVDPENEDDIYGCAKEDFAKTYVPIE